MQRRSTSASWESQLRSYEGPRIQDTASSREQKGPKAAHVAQSSSPSFLEAYAKYVEQKRDDRWGSQGSTPASPSTLRIKAFGSDSADYAEYKPTPDTQKDATDSSYTSWPASTDTVSPRQRANSLCVSGDAGASTPVRGDDSEGCAIYQSGSQEVRRHRSRTPEGQRGLRVAAAVDALESRCRLGQEPTTPTRQSHPLLSQDATADKLQTSSAPSSPWPNVHYEPPSPRRKYSVEVCVISPSDDGGAEPSDAATAAAAIGPPPFGGGAQPPLLAAGAMGGIDARLASALSAQPELRRKLLRLLREQQTGADDAKLGIQVQELMKDHPDLVESLNAQFKLQTGQTTGLQDALLSNASVHLVEDDLEPGPRRREGRSGGRKTYMVVMRGIDGAEISGLREELKRGRLTSWRDAATWLVPPKDRRYFPWSTCLVIGTVLCIFFFMAGAYAEFLEGTLASEPAPRPYTPQAMGDWLHFSPAWQTFDFEFLLLWGGQYLPAIREHQGWRWVTAAFVHAGFMHLLGNMLLFAVLGGILERRYGTLRMLPVLVLSTLGAAFFAGAFADACTQVVGASGAVLGFVGLTIADLVVNFGSLRAALLRLAITAVAVVFFIVTAVTQASDYTSNWSHLGGFVCGLFPSFLFLPDFKDRRWRKAQKLAERLGALRPRKSATASPPASGMASMRQASGVEERRANDPASAPDVEASGGGAAVPSLRLVLPRAPWLDGEAPSETSDMAGEPNTAVTDRVLENVALPPESRPHGGGAQENASPGESDNQPDLRLFTEEHSDGAFLHTMPNLRRIRCRRGVSPSETPRRFPTIRCNGALLPCILLGALVIIGVFTALPTYIYVHRLPNLHCSRS